MAWRLGHDQTRTVHRRIGQHEQAGIGNDADGVDAIGPHKDAGAIASNINPIELDHAFTCVDGDADALVVVGIDVNQRDLRPFAHKRNADVAIAKGRQVVCGNEPFRHQRGFRSLPPGCPGG